MPRIVHRLQTCLLALGLLALAGPAAALSLGDFEGRWQSTSLEPESGDAEAAAVELAIRAARDGGFAARWSNPPLAVASGVAPAIEALFAPTGRPDVFAFKPKEASLIGRLFADPATGNPLDGETLLWARLGEDALILYSLSIDRSGEPALIRSAFAPDGNELALEQIVRLGPEAPVVLRSRLARTGG